MEALQVSEAHESTHDGFATCMPRTHKDYLDRFHWPTKAQQMKWLTRAHHNKWLTHHNTGKKTATDNLHKQNLIISN